MIRRLLLIGLGLVLVREGWLAFVTRRRQRRERFQQARARAAELGRPLLVVGAPGAGFINALFGPDYTCGDVCTDLQGCSSCARVLEGPLEQVLPTLETDRYVVFVSCTLELVTDMVQVVAELQRVSGGELFVAHIEPASITAFVYPGVRRRILRAPPRGPFQWHELPWWRSQQWVRVREVPAHLLQRGCRDGGCDGGT